MAESEARQMLDPLFSELNDGVCLSNASGEILYMNAAAARIVAADPDEAQGTVICSHVCAKLAVAGLGPECASACPLASHRQKASTFTGVYGPRPNYKWGPGGLEPRDSYNDLRVHCQALETTLFDSWDPEKRLTILEDMGPEKQLERMKEDWRNMVAHDLRSPLTNIFGTLRIFEDSDLKEHMGKEEERLFTAAIRACGRMLDLLNLYLDVAKLDAGKMKTNQAKLSPAALVESCVAEQQAVAKERNISVAVDIPGDPPALGDEALAFRVVQNLLSNALKFTPENGHVWIAGRKRDGFVELELKDDGPGIAPEDLPFLFDRFYQVAARKASRAHGTGLGLTFCREALRAMKGSIDVQSEIGKGTAFLIRLPAA